MESTNFTKMSKRIAFRKWTLPCFDGRQTVNVVTDRRKLRNRLLPYVGDPCFCFKSTFNVKRSILLVMIMAFYLQNCLTYSKTRPLQSRINIGSDGTLARAPLWMGLKKGPPIYFLGPYLSKYYKTELKVQKNTGITPY